MRRMLNRSAIFGIKRDVLNAWSEGREKARSAVAIILGAPERPPRSSLRRSLFPFDPDMVFERFRNGFISKVGLWSLRRTPQLSASARSLGFELFVGNRFLRPVARDSKMELKQNGPGLTSDSDKC